MAEIPCGLCNKHCDEDTECVHCSGCDKWHHMKCVPMTSSQLAVWSDAKRFFLQKLLLHRKPVWPEEVTREVRLSL
jgi:hypothetical protein